MYASRYQTERSIYDVSRRGSTIDRNLASLVEAFYVDLLGGKEVWHTEHKRTRGSRWFVVDATLIEVRVRPNTPAPLELEVDEPEGLVQRAWDAGYTVDVSDEAELERVSLVDPTGRRLNLVRRPAQERRAVS